MKKHYLSFIAFGTVLLCLIFFQVLQLQAQQAEKIQPHILRVKFKNHVVTLLEKMEQAKNREGLVHTGMSPVDRLNAKFKVKSFKRVFPHAGKFEKKHRRYNLHLWYELELAEGVSTYQAIASFARLSEVVMAEPLYEKYSGVGSFSLGEAASVVKTMPGPPNDPQFSVQWHYSNTGQAGGKVGADIDLLGAWQIESGNADVIVGVIDTGIDINHEDLAGNMWVNKGEIPGNGIDDDHNGYTDDVYGYNFGDNTGKIPAEIHGTHVGGTIAAASNNNTGVAGVAGGSGTSDGVRLMSLAAFGESNVGGFDAAFIYAADNGAVIAQNSWGYTTPAVYEQSVLDAIDYFIAEAGYDENGNPYGPMQGGIVIFAAGNSGEDDQYYPGYYDKVLSVAGTNRYDTHYPSSNFGDWVDIAAPAEEVFSTLPFNAYGWLTGTSMACPHVSGVAALIISKFAGNIAPQQVWDRLVGSADQVKTLPPGFGSGRLNAFNALQDNDGIAPGAVTDLAVKQVFPLAIELGWTAPADEGNGKASIYDLRVSTAPINEANFGQAERVEGVPPASIAGQPESFKVEGLSPNTTYYFAIRALDFFGNVSNISNTVSGTTEDAPQISVSPQSIEADIDVSIDPVVSRTLSITNNGGGAALAFNLYSTLLSRKLTTQLYPGTDINAMNLQKYGQGNTAAAKPVLNHEDGRIRESIAPMMGAADSVYYDSGDNTAEYFIGMGNGDPITTAVRFEVEQPFFQLTHVRNFFRTEFIPDPEIIVEVYKGVDINTAELLLSQLVNVSSQEGEFFVIPLTQELAFSGGDVFWVITKYPYDINNPQGADDGYPIRDNTFFYSIDGGASFYPADFVFKVRALSAGDGRADWISFNPSSGAVEAGQTVDVEVIFDATDAYNGDYLFNILVNSDDPQNPVVAVPAQVKVSGQQANILVQDELLEYGQVFIGAQAGLPLTIKNTGRAVLEIADISSSHPAFSVNENSLSLQPEQEVTLRVLFTPEEDGLISGSLSINTNDPDQPTFEVLLTGVATAPPVIEVSPEQVTAALNAGETTTETITISNQGAYPLRFSFPQVAVQQLLQDSSIQKNNTARIEQLVQNTSKDKKKASVETKGHPVLLGAGSDLRFGYTWIDSDTEGGPAFIWEDISETGTEILQDIDDGTFYIELPFNFSFYGEIKNAVDISTNGILAFGPFGSSFVNLQIPDPEEPNDFIAPFWDDLRPFHELGNIYYTVDETGLTVQYEQVGNYEDSGTITFQVKLLPNGRIYFYYKGVESLEISNSATVGIENGNGTDGVQVVFQNNYVKDSLALLFMPPAPGFISDVSPVSGVVPVNGSRQAVVTLDATELLDGTYTQNLQIESNDPVNSPLLIPFTLIVTGQPQIAVEPAALNFDTVFIGQSRRLELQITNTGTKEFIVEDIRSTGGAFSVAFNGPVTVEPGVPVRVAVNFTPSAVGPYSETLEVIHSISEEGSSIVSLSGYGVESPVISVMPEAIYAEVAAGGMVHDTLEITNSGGYRLDYSIVSPNWVKPEPKAGKDAASLAAAEKLPAKGVADTRRGTPVQYAKGEDLGFGYTWEDNQDGGGPVFNWIDIAGTGTDITHDLNNGYFADTAREVSLGFSFNFYGTSYESVFVSANGLLYFGTQEDAYYTYVNERIPVPTGVQNLIAGFWADLEPGTIGGSVHYQASAESFIVQYTDVNSYFAPGTVTFQVILYADGGIKLQYKDVESAEFSSFGTIGIENADGTDGIEVVFNSPYIRNGLAIAFSGPVTGSVAPGQSVRVPIVLDASELLGGTYTDVISVRSNDVNNPLVEIPVTLRVSGRPLMVVSPDSLDFGVVYVHNDSVFSSIKEVMVSNRGSQELIISAVYVSDPSAFGLVTNRPIVVPPRADSLIQVYFRPTEVKSYAAELIIESDDPENNRFTVSLRGEGQEPPKFVASIPGDTLVVTVNRNESGKGIIHIANEGGSPLYFNARATAQVQAMARQGGQVATKYAALQSSLKHPKAMLSLAGSPGPARLSETTSVGLNFSDSLFYDIGNTADDFIGLPDPGIPIAIATRFVSPESGFTLSHIRNFYRTEGSYEAIHMAVLRGGNSPDEGTLIAVQEIWGGTAEGSFELISLDNPLVFDAGETFWVIFFYPPSIEFPQGVNQNIEGIEGIFYFSLDNGGSWDLFDNEVPYTAAKVRAYQSLQGVEWISLDPQQAELPAGASIDLLVNVDASELETGNYFASIRFTTNDPFYPQGSIPVKLQVVGMPRFVQVPEDTLQVQQQEELTVVLKAVADGGEITAYKLLTSYPNVIFTFNADSAILRFKPEADQAGLFNFAVEAVDDKGQAVLAEFVVQVTGENRPPRLVKSLKKVTIDYLSITIMIDLNEHFEDPDGDLLSFSATAATPGVVELEILEEFLLIRGLEKGKTAVQLLASDGRGGEAGTSFDVQVKAKKNKKGKNSRELLASGPYDEEMTGESEVLNYPNPFSKETTISYWLGEQSYVKLQVYNILGKPVSMLVDELQEKGAHTVSFRPESLSPGMYLYRLQIGERVISRRMIQE